MSTEDFWHQIEIHLQLQLNGDFKITHRQSISGGCISHAARISDGEKHFFVKYGHDADSSMFAAEFLGLQELAKANCIRVPKPICFGSTQGHSYLCLEYISLGASHKNTPSALGQQLAQLHRQLAPQYGWVQSNWIGSTPQQNSWHRNWVDFWAQERIGFQLSLAKQNGCPSNLLRKGNDLIPEIGSFFHHYHPEPSLLHGDLWSGNYGSDSEGNPVVFDPAIYFGDRETDIAMTELFGGFGNDFYQAYQQAYPLDAGYQKRKDLYNLYHILNHFNIFGGGYASQAQGLIDKLLSNLS